MIEKRGHETRSNHYGWSLHRKSRSGWLGVYSALQRPQEGAFRRRAADYQQPNGVNSRDPRAGRAARGLRSGSRHRFAIPQERNHNLDPRLEAKRMEDTREEAGGEPGFVDGI